MFEQAYGGQGVECDGLYMLGQGSGTNRRYGLVRVGMSQWAWVQTLTLVVWKSVFY